VEDVKAFYGILKVLFSFGVVFSLQFAADSTLPLFALHTYPYRLVSSGNRSSYQTNVTSPVEYSFVTFGHLSPLLTVVCIPLYLCLLRPFISRYIPGMLRRMGLGMVLTVLSLLTSLSMDTAAHMRDNNNTNYCMFSDTFREFLHPKSPHPTLNPAFPVIQLTLSALSRMLAYVAVFEFICSQSPHSMKGLLIGAFYAIRGLYQVLAALLTLPFLLVSSTHFHPSCGVYYYLMNTVVGLVAVLVYVCVSRRYRYRVRDELCNVHQYAEEYYSHPQRERHYNYSYEEQD